MGSGVVFAGTGQEEHSLAKLYLESTKALMSLVRAKISQDTDLSLPLGHVADRSDT